MTKQQDNQEIVLAKRPSGVPDQSTFEFRDIDVPKLKEGEVLLKSIYVSVDPGMRGFMDKGDDDDRGNKYELGKPITSRSVAQVVESRSKKFTKGDIVYGRLDWKKLQSFNADKLEKVNPDLAPISTALSILGVTGLAAYFGLIKIGNPQKGETVVVSGAAGSVGSVAVQIAKLKGCKVIGIAGSKEKIDYLENELGIDKGINYKKTNNMAKALKDACPNGIDVFFDNVGGEIADDVLEILNKNGRIVICGQIAEYNDENPPKGPRPQHALIQKSARMEGFVVFDFKDEFEDAKNQLSKWYNNGQMKYKENLIEGFENIPSAFIGLFSGDNIGKQLVKISEIEKQ
ncbi:NADP-dependent oxidoreductase [Aequorivita capsosiphonis]|uniref:NADP-dependent oxidoreductase n=1 Tax=Aequorivita capsosiphonis TaxID=487317 RepID=UPI000406C8A3|nr:NADP-dependent oxidoreductase [Aequorivita capsosiphonis]